MARFYTAIALIFVMSVGVFIGSFLFLDAQKHKTFYYTFLRNDRVIGTVKVDRYNTEERRIYKSMASLPYDALSRSSKAKIAYDKSYTLADYVREDALNGAIDQYLIENNDNVLSFVATSCAKFVRVKKLPVKTRVYVFEEDSPATYLALLENYDFSRGRAQGFHALTCFSPLLPPIRRFVTFTSIRDEFITLDNKRIKCECLIMKIRGYPQGMVWVSKSDRSLIAIEIPDKHLKVQRALRTRHIPRPQPRSFDTTSYSQRTVIFKSGTIALEGTLSVPRASGPRPAVVLIPGTGPQDRDYQGFFSSLAHGLAGRNLCVLRVDKRGIGESSGDASTVTANDELSDIQNAVLFAADQKEVDRAHIIVITHLSSAFTASRIPLDKTPIAAFVFMSPAIPIDITIGNDFDTLRNVTQRFRWPDEYYKTVVRATVETIDTVRNTSGDWVSVSGRKCFTKRLKEEFDTPLFDGFKNIGIPVLTLQCKDESSLVIDYAQEVDTLLNECGHTKHNLVAFGYLNNFYGKEINDGIHQISYEVDQSVCDIISQWCAQYASPEGVPESAAPSKGV